MALRIKYDWIGPALGAFFAASALSACHLTSAPLDPIARGEQIFFNETFEGNGRTCGTCHRADDNFGLTPAFIASLPPDDPLFVAETNPELAQNFENPVLMRQFGLILENQDGFEDLANDFNMRGIPHVLALSASVASSQGPRTGWSGDGSPGDGSLRSFSTGAVIQHFPLTTNRIAEVDFRLPNDEELDALEAFMLSLGRSNDLELPLPLRGLVAARGQEIFRDNALGKCNVCHFNAGANADPAILGDVGNQNFNTGVEDLPDQPADLTDQRVPPDDGFGSPGNGEFNTPPLVEAADTGPFFHNNSVETIEGAVAFYNGDTFNNSPAGQIVQQASGSGINLEATQVVEVAAFLRVINALENIRASIELLERAARRSFFEGRRAQALLARAVAETQDSVDVLAGAGLHPEAVLRLEEALGLTMRAVENPFGRGRRLRAAIRAQQRARDLLVRPAEGEV